MSAQTVPLPVRRQRQRAGAPAALALLGRIDAFIEATGVPQSVIGRDALNDSGAINYLRRGRVPSYRNMQRLDEYMAQWAKKRDRLAREASRAAQSAYVAMRDNSTLAEVALQAADSEPRKAIEMLRIAIESIQPMARAA